MNIFSWFKRKKQNISSSSLPASMGIQEFVKASIIGIMSGIKEAQKEYDKGNSAFDPIICPAWGPPISDIGGSAKGHADKIHELEFDLAITITEASSTKANGSARVKVIGVYSGELGCLAESTGTQSTISRIRFNVPIRYPLTKLGKPNWKESR